MQVQQARNQSGIRNEELGITAEQPNDTNVSTEVEPNNPNDLNNPNDSNIPTETTDEIQGSISTEEILENGDKLITNYRGGEVATISIERNGKITSVDIFQEGKLFKHTEYDENGKATSVTRYDKQGNAVSIQNYVEGKTNTTDTNDVNDANDPFAPSNEEGPFRQGEQKQRQVHQEQAGAAKG